MYSAFYCWTPTSSSDDFLESILRSSTSPVVDLDPFNSSFSSLDLCDRTQPSQFMKTMTKAKSIWTTDPASMPERYSRNSSHDSVVAIFRSRYALLRRLNQADHDLQELYQPELGLVKGASADYITALGMAHR
jgi:hypothetical protein